MQTHPSKSAMQPLVPMRQPPDPAAFARMITGEMRDAFLLAGLFVPGALRWFYTQVDRAVIGGIVPAGAAITLPGCRELAVEYFTQRRELGVINLAGPGMVRLGDREVHLDRKEALYVGKGNPSVEFHSADPADPAQFYFVSYPAHAVFPSEKVKPAKAVSATLGSAAESNRRTIHRLIHPGGIQSCQLTMGYTELAEGSVWNTMPAHTHARRSEIYLYCNLPDDGVVVHCMGQPGETRHLIVRNLQAVVSPAWSTHFGAGTTNYAFVWAMGGENQEFSDMDPISMESLM